MTSIKAFSITAASLAAGLSLLSVSGNAAQANPYNTFGAAGGCDSFAMGGGNARGGGFVRGRDCGDHRDWASDEARRNRRHSTQSQLIGLGGGLIGQLINSSQKRHQQQPARPSADLALIQQQQEIELLKMKLQLQQQQRSPYGYRTVSNTYPPAVQPVYHQAGYGHVQQTSYQRTAYPQPVYQQPAYHQPQPRYHY